MDTIKPEDDDAAATRSTGGERGDPADAGETTAADTITGPTDTRPVGTDTMLKVSDEPKHEE